MSHHLDKAYERDDARARTDEGFMRRALELAERGAGRVNPNPLVGAVIVREGRVIGEGWHTQYGKPHAEREALADCRARGEDARGATVYVTLEPCCHTGKTPPCTEALKEAGVARVVVGAPDPNPLVAGNGVRTLREAGIDVAEGVLLEACQRMNEPFFHFISTGKPLVIAKYAMTLDGKVTHRAGAPCRITGETARRRAHEDRRRYAAVMVGVGTVLADDPQLTCRLDGAEDAAVSPVRIVCDSRLRTPLDARLVATARRVPTIVATCAPPSAYGPLEARGCQVVQLPADEAGQVDLAALVAELGRRGLDSLIVEGGPTLLAAAFAAGIVDKVQAYVAPRVFGGAEAPSAVGGPCLAVPGRAISLSSPRVTRLGEDLLLESEVV